MTHAIRAEVKRASGRSFYVRRASKPVHPFPFQFRSSRNFSNRYLIISSFPISTMNPNTDKLVKRTTMVATAVAGYFLLTADYGPEPNVLDPVSFLFLLLFLLYLGLFW